MGFFSWKTADTEESIGNVHSGNDHSREHGPVYLLSPDGNHIREDGYEGYGVFGGVDAFVWVALTNLPEASSYVIDDVLGGVSSQAIDEAKRALLSGENVGGSDDVHRTIASRLRDTALLAFGKGLMFDPVTDQRIIRGQDGIPFRYDQSIEKYNGKTLGELNKEGFFTLKDIEPDYPLKFSFDKGADYNLLPASENCPDQGYFYSSAPR